MTKMLEIVIALGLRSPEEDTKRDMAMAVLLMVSGPGKVLAMTQASRVSYVHTFRAVWTKAKQRAPSVPRIRKLEDSPDELKRQRPGVYAAVYASEAPVMCPLSQHTYEHVRAHTPCRAVKGGAAQQRQEEPIRWQG